MDRPVVHNDVLQFTSYLAADSYYDVRITPDMVRDRVGNSHRGLKAGAYVVRTTRQNPPHLDGSEGGRSRAMSIRPSWCEDHVADASRFKDIQMASMLHGSPLCLMTDI